MIDRIDENLLIPFLKTTSEKFAANEVSEVIEDLTTVGEADDDKYVSHRRIISDGTFDMVDTYLTDKEADVDCEPKVRGHSIVSFLGRPVWSRHYSAQANQDVLDFYRQQVMLDPNPDLPIIGRQGFTDKEADLCYEYEPFPGSDLTSGLTIARFAIKEYVFNTETGRVFSGYTIGGWQEL